MAVSRYFSVVCGAAARPQIRLEKHENHSSRNGTTLLFDGLVYALKGEPPLPARLPGPQLADILLRSYLRQPGDFFNRVEGQCTIVIVNGTGGTGVTGETGVKCFRSALSPAQIYYSDRALSNRLLPVYQASAPAARSAEYYLDFLLDLRTLHYDSVLTPFEGIHRLKPGSLVTLAAAGGTTLVEAIAAPQFFYSQNSNQRVEDAALEVKALLDTAIESRLGTTDTPVACELSGGLDSSFITALVASKASKVSAIMYSYSRLPSHKFSEDCARSVAQKFGIPLTVFDLGDLPKADLSTAQPYRDEPTDCFWQGALFGPPTREVLPENGVLFGGFGADQLYMRDPIVMPWQLRKGELRTFMRLLADSAQSMHRSQAHLLWQSLLLMLPRPIYLGLSAMGAKMRFNPFALEEMEPNSLLLEPVSWLEVPVGRQLTQAGGTAEESIHRGRIRLDFSYMVAPSFNTDPYYETRGVRSAHPFCDGRLINHALGKISWNLVHDWKNPYKHLLREAQHGLVPEQVRTRSNNEFFFNGFLAQVLKANQDYLRDLIQTMEAPGGLQLSKPGMQTTLEEMLFGLSKNSSGKLLNAIGYELWWRDFQASARQPVPEQLPRQ